MIFNKWNNIIKQIKNIKKPTKEDYIKIQDYLQSERPYLKDLINYYGDINNRRLGRTFNFISENGDMPQRIYHKGIKNDRVIFLYASYNRKYIKLAKDNFDNLISTGYDGDIILYLGGYPNLDGGSLKYANLPYNFKLMCMMEAERLKYHYFLWIDTAVIAQDNINFIFDILFKKGLYLNKNCKIKDSFDNPNSENIGSIETFKIMNISYNNALNADVISGGIMGFDLTYLVYKKFIKIIESYLKLKLPFMCPCADTAVISIALAQTPHIITYEPSQICNSKTKLFFYDHDH